MSGDQHSFNPFRTPSAVQMAATTLRLGLSTPFRWALASDPGLFALFYATCASSIDSPFPTADDDTGALSALLTDSQMILSTVKELSRMFSSEVGAQLARLYVHGMDLYSRYDVDDLEPLLSTWAASAREKADATLSSQEVNVDRLGTLLGLSESEKRLFSLQLNRDATGYGPLYRTLTSGQVLSILTLTTVLDVSAKELHAMLDDSGRLVSSGLLSVRHNPLTIGGVSEHLRAVLSVEADEEWDFFKRFVAPIVVKPSTSALGRLDERDRAVLTKLMTMAIPEGGVHVLAHGPSSIDKRDLIARELENVGEVYSVVSKEVPPGDRPIWVHVAQRWVRQHRPHAVLVIDDTERILSSRAVSFMSLFGLSEGVDEDSEDLASDDELTRAPIRCVWLANRPRMLSERNLGEFLFHCEVRPGSRADRRGRIAAIVAEAGLGESIEASLAKYSMLAEQPVRQAARLAMLLHTEDDTAGREATIKRAVQQAQRVLGRDGVEELRESVTHYDLGLLNLNSRFSPEQIVSSLRARQSGSLLFHGIPGAGKTQFAEYLAVQLDRPILMKRASDILSKWVGESEQNIAGMFEEAEHEGAILFIDEADSFLRDRTLARAEWSVTQVNELLQHLERASGVVICATNLMGDIDAAAMRRFTFKIEFKALREDQAWQMFCTESGFEPETDAGLTQAYRERLGRIRHLAPGDFATVKRMALILIDDSPMGPEEWLGQLESEAKDKMHGLERHRLGFGPS